MGDDEKNAAAPAAGSGATAAPAPAHARADPPAGGGTSSTADKPPQGDSSSPPRQESSPATPSPAATGPAAASKDKSSGEDTAATAADDPADDPKTAPATPPKADGSKPVAILASSKKARPPYKYDPSKITLRFIFANRDGLTVTVECNPSDTVGEVKGALLSVWPEDLPDCAGGELLRLVCMGIGFLMPDTRTLEDCKVPVFKTHPTPVNVSVRPNIGKGGGAESPSKSGGPTSGDPAATPGMHDGGEQTSQGCACIIL